MKPEAAKVLREEARRCVVAAEQLRHVRTVSVLLQELGNLMISLAQKFDNESGNTRARDQGETQRERATARQKRRSDRLAC